MTVELPPLRQGRYDMAIIDSKYVIHIKNEEN